MRNNGWQNAIDKFLDQWKNRSDFIGAILSGSYAIGCQTKNSDIDIMIVITDKTKWERGSVIINGILIEYIADPYFFWAKAFKEEYSSGRKVTINMFAIGKVLIDKNGIVAELKAKAEDFMRKSFKKMKSRELEMAKYYIYSGIDELKSLINDGFVNYAPVYYLHLSNILRFYANFTGASLPSPAKVSQFLNDSEFRKKYELKGFTDKEFVRLFNNSLENYSSLAAIKELTQYVLNKLGGFDVNGWVLKTDIKKMR